MWSYPDLQRGGGAVCLPYLRGSIDLYGCYTGYADHAAADDTEPCDILTDCDALYAEAGGPGDVVDW